MPNTKALPLFLTVFLAFAATMATPASAQPGLGLKDGERVNPNVAAQVDLWIEQMESPKAAERRNAARQLERIGAAAIKPLETLALNGGLDASERAFEILKKHLNGDFPELSDKAREALQRIAEGKDLAKSRTAERMLTPQLEETQRPEFRPPAPRQQMQQFARRTSVKISSVNGVQDIAVDQDGEKYRFRDSGNGISIERPDGKGGMKKAEYKDEDALKKADKEAFEIYKRYAKQAGGGIQIQMGGGFGGGGFRGGGFPAFPQVPGNQFFPFGNPQFQPGFPAQPNAPQAQPPRLRPLPPKAPAPKNDSDIIEV